jgi:drug/metabolite transporter (DMT)-like permease
VSRRAWALFLFLAALWGASYMFIKVALDDGMPPVAIVCIRTALAAIVLMPVAARMGALRGLQGRLGSVAVLAAVQVAAPFVLITLGERHLASSLSGILVATAPIFAFLLAFVLEGEQRANGVSLTGVGIGIVGVGLLLGVDSGGGTAALVGGLMTILASLGYALGAWYLKRNLADAQPVGIVATTMTASALMTAPVIPFDPPTHFPALDAAASLFALGVLGTGVAFVIFYWLIGTEGPARATLVAYVAPGFAVLYGVSLLGEDFGVATAAGLLLIVGGSWLAAEGRAPWRRRAPAAAPSAEAAAAEAAA